MRRTNLRRELVALCRGYTGEHATPAGQRIGPVVERFTPAEREVVVDALRGGAGPGRPLVGSGRTVAAELGAALLPDACSYDQQALEAELLQAVLRVADRHLLYRYPMNRLRRAHALGQVRPGAAGSPQGVTVTLDEPAALGPVLWELLPQHDPDANEVTGASGVRVRHAGRAVQVTRLGTAAAITITGVDGSAWLAAQQYLSRVCVPQARQVWLWERSPHEMTPEELDHQRRYRALLGPVGLASALLRRLHVLHRCRSFTGWSSGDRWKIVCSAGPTPREITTALLHPLFGLPGPFTVDQAGASWVVLRSDDERSAGATVPVRLAVHRGDQTDLTAASRLRGTALEGPFPQWTAWEAATSAAPPAPAARAAARAALTGETPSAALAGVGPDGTHGFDHCTEAQRALRAQLALHTFNGDSQNRRGPCAGILYTITHYTMIISPRHDDLVIFTDAPDNLTSYFVRRSRLRMPGIRLVERPNGGTFRLRHLLTGATMTITSRAETDFRVTDSRGSWSTDHGPGPDQPITAAEHDANDRFPVASPDAATLLAAVWLRMSTADPHQEWAAGTWFCDPLDRPKAARDADWLRERQLTGRGESWRLRWSGFPSPFDVAAPIVDPTIGLPGALVEELGAGYTLSYGTAELHVQPL